MSRTKYENKYFTLAESFSFRLDIDTGIFYFDELDEKLSELFPNFVSEILENSTRLTGNDRQLYYERIKSRAIQMGIDIQFVDTKPGQWQYSYEGDLIINPPLNDDQYIGFDKAVICFDGKEYPITEKCIESRKQVLISHKQILIQQINRFFPDLAKAGTKTAGTLPPELPEPTAETSKNKQRKPTEIPQTLKECFENEDDYINVMNILSEKKYIDPVNNHWTYSKKGKQSLVCAFVKDVKNKKYFKTGIKLNWDLAKEVIQNTFGVEIGSNKTFHDAELPPNETGIIPYCNKK